MCLGMNGDKGGTRNQGLMKCLQSSAYAELLE